MKEGCPPTSCTTFGTGLSQLPISCLIWCVCHISFVLYWIKTRFICAFCLHDGLLGSWQSNISCSANPLTKYIWCQSIQRETNGLRLMLSCGFDPLGAILLHFCDNWRKLCVRGRENLLPSETIRNGLSELLCSFAYRHWHRVCMILDFCCIICHCVTNC